MVQVESLTLPIYRCFISSSEFVSHLVHWVYPGTCGSSGIVLRYLSNTVLNVSTLQSVMFRMCNGKQLKSPVP